MQNFNALSGDDRKAAIDAFIAQLSDWERIRVRRYLHQAPLKFACLPDIPQEAICQIIPHLSLKDVLACLLVSRGWHSAWSQMAVVVDLCNQFFPGALQVCPSTAPSELFAKFAATRVRSHFQAWNRNAIPWDPNWSTKTFTNELPLPSARVGQAGTVTLIRAIQYADGILAWQSDYDLLIVDNLFTRTRRRFAIGPGPMSASRLMLEGVSKKMMVAAGLGPANLFNALHVHHFDHGVWKRLVLPNPILKTYVEGERVGAVTSAGNIVLWSWGRNMTEVQVQKRPPRECGFNSPTMSFCFKGVPGLILHPGQPDIFYAVWIARDRLDRKTACNLLVVKYQGTKPIWHSFKSILSPLGAPRPACRNNSSIITTLSCEKADSQGTYTLCFFKFREDLADCGCPFRGYDTRDFGTVSFNIGTDTFATHSYQTRDPIPVKNETGAPVSDDVQRRPLHSLTVWNDTMFFSVQRGEGHHYVENHSIVLKTYPPTEGSKSPAVKFSAIIRLMPRCFENPGLGQVFTDDDFLLLRTRNGLAVWNRRKPMGDKERDSESSHTIYMRAAEERMANNDREEFPLYERHRPVIPNLTHYHSHHLGKYQYGGDDTDEEQYETDQPPTQADRDAMEQEIQRFYSLFSPTGPTLHSRWVPTVNIPLLHNGMSLMGDSSSTEELEAMGYDAIQISFQPGL